MEETLRRTEKLQADPPGLCYHASQMTGALPLILLRKKHLRDNTAGVGA